MSEKLEDRDELRPAPLKAAAGPVEEWRGEAAPLNGEPKSIDSGEYGELKEDMAAAQEAVEEYEARGIEGTISYSQYRAQRFGTES